MDRSQFSRFYGAVKAFLLSKRSREALIFTFFLIISAGFWLMLTLNDSYEMEVSFPLALENVDEGAVITSDLPSSVQVTLRDKGTALMGYVLRLHQSPLNVDFKAHDNGAEYAHVTISHSEVQKMLTPLLQTSSRIVAIRPDTIDYYFSRGSMKRVPVAFRGSVQVEPPNYLVAVRCEPDTVTVWGEKLFLDSLTVVPTAVTNFTSLTKTATRSVALTPIRGIKFEPAEVKVTADVDVYVEKKVLVPIVGTNFPGDLTLRTFPAKATVSFRVGFKDANRYDSLNFVITATYEELIQSPDSLLHLKLRSVPEGISQVTIEPESVQFLIEQTEVE